MQLVVLIIILTGLWIAFGLPWILSKVERPMMSVNEVEIEIEVEFEQPSYEPAFYDYYDDAGQIVRAEGGSIMYMLIYQSLNRRR